MGLFIDFLVPRMALAGMLKEHSELLDPQAMDDLFHKEAKKLLPGVKEPRVREDLVAFLKMRPTAYIDRALRRTGMPDADLDEAIQGIVVKLLYSPGGLFSGWDRHYPFTPRFKVSVKNAVISLAQNRQRRARKYRELPADPVARKSEPSEDTIAEFRNWIEFQYGEPVARVLDQRLAGEAIRPERVGWGDLRPL